LLNDEAPNPEPADEGDWCETYLATIGCGWTQEWSCPGELVGSSGIAQSDGSLGFTCCCSEEQGRNEAFG
jgi:hypothetical protein